MLAHFQRLRVISRRTVYTRVPSALCMSNITPLRTLTCSTTASRNATTCGVETHARTRMPVSASRHFSTEFSDKTKSFLERIRRESQQAPKHKPRGRRGRPTGPTTPAGGAGAADLGHGSRNRNEKPSVLPNESDYADPTLRKFMEQMKGGQASGTSQRTPAQRKADKISRRRQSLRNPRGANREQLDERVRTLDEEMEEITFRKREKRTLKDEIEYDVNPEPPRKPDRAPRAARNIISRSVNFMDELQELEKRDEEEIAKLDEEQSYVPPEMKDMAMRAAAGDESAAAVTSTPGRLNRQDPKQRDIVNAMDAERRKKLDARRAKKKANVKHQTVNLPSYISSNDLARIARMTLRDFSVRCRRVIDWWPQQTVQQLKKLDWRPVKDIVFSYHEARQVLRKLGFRYVAYEEMDPVVRWTPPEVDGEPDEDGVTKAHYEDVYERKERRLRRKQMAEAEVESIRVPAEGDGSIPARSVMDFVMDQESEADDSPQKGGDYNVIDVGELGGPVKLASDRIVSEKDVDHSQAYWSDIMEDVQSVRDMDPEADSNNMSTFVIEPTLDELRAAQGKRGRRRRIRDPPHQVVQVPPIVSILGHVNHGKTTLLDSLRGTSVATSEAGSITQDIYAVHMKLDKQTYTFLDTPGHQEFVDMRDKGAYFANFALLVVAADEGIQAQTVESVQFLQDREVPIVVVLNKTDLVSAERLQEVRDSIKKQFDYTLHSKVVSPFHPDRDVVVVETCATKPAQLNVLREVMSDMRRLVDAKADIGTAVEPLGAVIESYTSHGRGHVIRVLMFHGVLRPREHFVCGIFHGRVQSIRDCNGKPVREAKPGEPVELTGVKGGLPMPGDTIWLGDKDVCDRAARLRQLEIQYPMQPRFDGDHDEAAVGSGVIDPTSALKRILEKDSKAENSDDDTKSTSTTATTDHVPLDVREDEPLEFTDNQLRRAIDLYERTHIQLRLVVKTNNTGNLHTVLNFIERLQQRHQNLDIAVVHSGVGSVNKRDLMYAAAEPGTVVYAFRLPSPGKTVLKEARHLNVRLTHFHVFYHLLEFMQEQIAASLTQQLKLQEAEQFSED
jgi:small GTP-binding protein